MKKGRTLMKRFNQGWNTKIWRSDSGLDEFSKVPPTFDLPTIVEVLFDQTSETFEENRTSG
jgi:hypothetical protein